ncbi:SPJ_0845 family protein [Streptococcus sp. zg-JUN1979]
MAITHKRQDSLEKLFAGFATLTDPKEEAKENQKEKAKD